jgi:hypothetical protein
VEAIGKRKDGMKLSLPSKLVEKLVWKKERQDETQLSLPSKLVEKLVWKKERPG